MNKGSVSPAQARYRIRFKTYTVRDFAPQSAFSFNRQWLGKGLAFVAVFSLIFSSFGTASIAQATSGSIKTTNTNCAVVNGNTQYNVGDHVWVSVSNFDENTSYAWTIIGQPGSSDSGATVASGNQMTDGDGDACFDTGYVIQDGDNGVYKVNFGGKNDNYSVNGDDGEPSGDDLTVQIIKVWQDAQGNPIPASQVPNKDDLTITAKNHDTDPAGPLVTCTYTGDALGCDQTLTIQQDGYEIDVTEPNLPTGWVAYSGVGVDQTPICSGDDDKVEGQIADCTHTVINRQVPVNPFPTIVQIHKVWQDSEGNPVPAPDNKSDIKITVTFGEADHSTCTYSGNDLVCSDIIYNPNGGSINIVETGLPTGWEVDDNTVGVIVPTCQLVEVDSNIVVGDQYPICHATVINKLKTPAPCNTQLVGNGGFEAPIVTTNQQWDVFASGTPNLAWSAKWVRTGGSEPAIANVELHRGVSGWVSHGGQQHTELDSDWGGPTSGQSGEDASIQLFQDLVTKVGHKYTITFWTSPRPGQGIGNNVTKVEMGGSILDTITEDGSSNSNTSWNQHTYTFTATSGLSRLSFTDMGAGDSLGGFLDDVSVKEQCSSDVTICKYDNHQTPLPGWDVYLKGEKVDTVTVNPDGSDYMSTSLPAGDYELVASGKYVYRPSDPSASESDAAYSKRLPSDSVYGGPFAPWVRELDFPTPYTGWLGIDVDHTTSFDWGSTFNPLHKYSGAKNLASAGQISFRILDDYYEDNSGHLTVDIYPIYKGTTGRNGCVTITVPLGDYQLGEVMQEGWQNVFGDGSEVVVNDSEENFTLVNQCVSEQCSQPVPKLHLIKVVCDQASDVAGNENANQFDGTNGMYTQFYNYDDGEFDLSYLMDGYVTPNEIPGKESGCYQANDWQFKLSTDQAQENNVQTVTTSDGEYMTPISGSGSDLSSELQQGIRGQNDYGFWVSEVEQEGYDFAALRCNNDVLYGDNLEYVNIGESNPSDIYCIAYNITHVEPCQVQDPSIASGNITNFVGLTETDPVTTSGLNNPASYPNGTSGSAVAAGPTGFPGAWDGPQNDPNITEGGAFWVSNDSVQPTNPPGPNPGQNGAVDTWRLYTHTFTIPAGATSLSPAVLYFSADNEVTAFLDGTQVGFNNSFAVTATSPLALTTGTHTLAFAVKNWAFEPENNPTGLIYNLDFTYCGEPTGQGGDLYSISGKVYHDNNSQNGTLDTGSEDGLPTWTIYIDGNDNNTLDGSEPSTETNTTGDFAFNNLLAGCYTIREVLKDGWTQTEPTAVDDYEYLVSVGGASCSSPTLLQKVKDFFIPTVSAAIINPDNMNFGNIETDRGGCTGNCGGGGGGGSSGGGGGGSTPTPPGRVLGDDTTVPSEPTPQVLGAVTELPRTGMPMLNLILMFAATLGILLVPTAIQLKKAKVQKQ